MNSTELMHLILPIIFLYLFVPTRVKRYYIELADEIYLAQYVDTQEWFATDVIEAAWTGNRRKAEKLLEDLQMQGLKDARVVSKVEYKDIDGGPYA